MINDNETPFVDTYSRYLQTKAQLKVYNERLNSYGLNMKNLEELIEEQLEAKEHEVFFDYNSNQKSLKRIAYEQDYSYPYIRKIYITAKSKIEIIANVSRSKKNKANNI